MLQLKYLSENFDLAKKCLERYDTKWENVDRMLPYFRISSNAIYPFCTKSGKRCVLRLSPVEEKDIREVESEIRLIEWLRGQNFPAMKPYPMTDGKLFTVIDTEWGKYNMSCFEMICCETLEDCDGTPELVRGYGRTLGRMHACLKDYPYGDTRCDHTALMAEVYDRFTAYNAPPMLVNEWKDVSEALKVLPVNAENYGVVHYDFEADNVLYCEETDLYGVIDFDDAVRCWYALDVIRALDCLGDVCEDVPADVFLSGYREECPFTGQQEKSLPLMRRLVHLQEYATILHVLSEPVNDEPEWMTEIIANLQRRLHQIENSIEENSNDTDKTTVDIPRVRQTDGEHH